MKEYLLSDENNISKEDYTERKKLISIFQKMPLDFFSKLRHFQPQVGCLNACTICSKYASNNVAFWDESRIRNVVAALKQTTPHKEKPRIVWDRDNHRSGVVFSYLDNDVGNYTYLDKFVDIAYCELGVKTRISTVGFSRHNRELNNVHKRVANNNQALAGVRLSFTPYEIGWMKCNNKFSREDYEEDIANFLKIYKPYYDIVGSGSRNFCVELRYKPLVINTDVFVFRYQKRFVIAANKYVYISKEENINFIDTQILDAKVHRLSLNNEGIYFERFETNKIINSKEDAIVAIKNNCHLGTFKVYRVKNRDGYYYSVSPKLTDNGNYGINFYPKTKKRLKSGIIILERFFLNTLFDYKKKHNLSANDEYPTATWKDVNNVLKNLLKLAYDYQEKGYTYKYNYIINELYPLIETYAHALKKAKYEGSTFFDKNFTIDTGIICNLGRAIKEFKGLVSVENEPLTLNHERNYGKTNSTMVIESVAWRLSCDYDDKIVVEEMNLSETATKKGQVQHRKKIKLSKKDIVFKSYNLKNKYLIPGQKE